MSFLLLLVSSALAQDRIAITGATVWAGNGPPMANAVVLIEKDRVTDVGVNLKIPDGVARVDLEGHNVYPGLIDAGAERWLSEEALPITPRADYSGVDAATILRRKDADANSWIESGELTFDRKSTRLNSSHLKLSRMPSSA